MHSDTGKYKQSTSFHRENSTNNSTDICEEVGEGFGKFSHQDLMINENQLRWAVHILMNQAKKVQ